MLVHLTCPSLVKHLCQIVFPSAGPVGPLEVGDQVMLARWLLHRLGEDFNIISTFNPKPVKGDWNGAPATFYGSVSMFQGSFRDVEGCNTLYGQKAHPACLQGPAADQTTATTPEAWLPASALLQHCHSSSLIAPLSHFCRHGCPHQLLHQEHA